MRRAELVWLSTAWLMINAIPVERVRILLLSQSRFLHPNPIRKRIVPLSWHCGNRYCPAI